MGELDGQLALIGLLHDPQKASGNFPAVVQYGRKRRFNHLPDAPQAEALPGEPFDVPPGFGDHIQPRVDHPGRAFGRYESLDHQEQIRMQLQAVLPHHVGNRHQELADVHLLQRDGVIAVDDIHQFPFQAAAVRVADRLAQTEKRRHKAVAIPLEDGLQKLDEHPAVVLRQPSHHAPVDKAQPVVGGNHHVAGMGIGMEEPVVENLSDGCTQPQ